MTRECSGCGLRSCDGIECYLEADPEAVERNENLLKLSEQYRMTETQLRKRPDGRWEIAA